MLSKKKKKELLIAAPFIGLFIYGFVDHLIWSSNPNISKEPIRSHEQAVGDVKNGTAIIYYYGKESRVIKPIHIRKNDIELIKHLPKNYRGKVLTSAQAGKAIMYNSAVLEAVRKFFSDQKLVQKMYTVSPTFFSLESYTPEIDIESMKGRFNPEEVLPHFGITFPPGAAWYRGMATSQAEMKNTEENHQRFAALLKERGLGRPGFERQDFSKIKDLGPADNREDPFVTEKAEQADDGVRDKQ